MFLYSEIAVGIGREIREKFEHIGMLSCGFRMQVFNLPIWCKFTTVLTILLDSNVQVLGSNV